MTHSSTCGRVLSDLWIGYGSDDFSSTWFLASWVQVFSVCPLNLGPRLKEQCFLGACFLLAEHITEPRLAACLGSEANNLRNKCQEKEKMLWPGKLAVRGDGELVSRDQLWRFCSVMTVFKGKNGEEAQWITKAGGWVLHYFPLCVDWLTLSSDVMLPAVGSRATHFFFFLSDFFLSRKRINMLDKAWYVFRRAIYSDMYSRSHVLLWVTYESPWDLREACYTADAN